MRPSRLRLLLFATWCLLPVFDTPGQIPKELSAAQSTYTKKQNEAETAFRRARQVRHVKLNTARKKLLLSYDKSIEKLEKKLTKEAQGPQADNELVQKLADEAQRLQTQRDRLARVIYDPVTTKWHQAGAYAAFVPGKKRLGCWSIAAAQILFFHRVKPSGDVRYEYRTGEGENKQTHVIEERDMSRFRFDWDQFEPVLRRPAAAAEGRAEGGMLERYCYFAAVTFRKHFGTGRYGLSPEQQATAIATHYGCKARVFRSRRDTLLKVTSVLEAELAELRPVILFMGKKDGSAVHAFVVDACYRSRGRLWVHTCFGAGGNGDGWFDFDKSINGFDGKTRLVLTIDPD